MQYIYAYLKMARSSFISVGGTLVYNGKSDPATCTEDFVGKCDNELWGGVIVRQLCPARSAHDSHTRQKQSMKAVHETEERSNAHGTERNETKKSNCRPRAYGTPTDKNLSRYIRVDDYDENEMK